MCKDADPATTRQLGLPSTAVKAVAEEYRKSKEPRLNTTAELVVVAFFFLLRVGEYTPNYDRTRKKRTVPLRRQDVRLWKGNREISTEDPWERLAEADGATITLENQKNGQKGCVLHHTATKDSSMCPVLALARLVHASRGLPRSTGLGTFRKGGSDSGRVTANDIRAAVRQSVELDHLEAQGYDASRIGSHSLRSGGAIALRLAGYDSDMIKKLGRWSSNTYLIYIQSQIAQLTAGVAEGMRQPLRWLQVG